MKISRSAQYALIATSYIAQISKNNLVLAGDISSRYSLPLEYLLKILQQLVRANILNSKRGPRGGFSLARPAEKISLLEIVEAVEGRVHAGRAADAQPRYRTLEATPGDHRAAPKPVRRRERYPPPRVPHRRRRRPPGRERAPKRGGAVRPGRPDPRGPVPAR